MRGWKKIFHANRDQKKAGVVILISDKIDFKMKNILRDKEDYYTMLYDWKSITRIKMQKTQTHGD